MIAQNARLSFAVGLLWLVGTAPPAPAACDTCAAFAPAVSWGTVTANGLTEASGIAPSWRSPGVLWSHNDGSRQRIYAFSTNGTYLAGLSLNAPLVDDVEDIATGSGPVPGASYLYVGDMGATGFPNFERQEIRIFRVPEPAIDHSWSNSPVTGDFDSVETIFLRYPDGGHDAEALLYDSRSGDVFVIIKHPAFARVYAANLLSATDGSILVMRFERQLSFASVSAGDLSADGTRILIRREDFAMTWARCDGETIPEALARAGASVPLAAQEPNGEGITMLKDGTGYVTISEGTAPAIYFFESQCPVAPRFVSGVSNVTVMAGGNATLTGTAVSYPPPSYYWRLNGVPLQGLNSNVLQLVGVTVSQAGSYELIASNHLGSVSSSGILTVNARPDLRITEVQPNPAPSPGVPTQDWWELTSFETQPVDLSGWRFNDSSGDLADPFVIGPGLVIEPGETIIFVEDLDAAQFRAWWGSSNLPASLKIVTYSGAGLSFGASGDGIRLWSSLATAATDTVARVDFGAAADGVTFNYNPATEQFGVPSQLGVNGVFQAASSPDIGSPGTIYGALEPPLLRISQAAGRVRIELNGAPGTTYDLQARGDLGAGQWIPTGDSVRLTASAPVLFEVPVTAGRLFYRVVAHR